MFLQSVPSVVDCDAVGPDAISESGGEVAVEALGAAKSNLWVKDLRIILNSIYSVVSTVFLGFTNL